MRNDARGAVSLLAGLVLVVALPSSAAPLFKYYGGKVVSNAQVVQVYWTSAVNSTVQTGLPGFYTAVLDSAYIDWLSEYSTVGVTPVDGQPGSQQRIGRGNFVSAVTITPANTAKTLSNVQIGTELAAQIAAGHVPAPTTDAGGNVNTVYMVDFPPGYTITVPGGTSCVNFCAAYDTMPVGTKSVGIGLFPEIATGPCSAGCGSDANQFNNVTAVHAGELIQIITDLELPLAATIPARPVAWFSNQPTPDNGNIADVCHQQHATVAGFVVETGWSNKLASCIASTPTPLPLCDGTTTYCRQCSASDNGQAAGCNGVRPACQTDSTSAARGQCIACVTDAQCTGNSAGAHCLGSGACGAGASPVGTPVGGSNSGLGGGGCSSTGALPFATVFAIAFGSALRRRRPAGDT